MNDLHKSADVLKTSWCKGAYRSELPEGTTFCAAGALFEVKGLYEGWKPEYEHIIQDSGHPRHEEVRNWYQNSFERFKAMPELPVLYATIAEQYPDQIETGIEFNSERMAYAVFDFNDDIAQSADEVVAVFEKAAVKMDELV